MAEQKRVLALGFFDGIHTGHGVLISRAREMAVELGAQPAVLTFDLHPDTLIFKKPMPLINSPLDRRDIVHRIFGVSEVLFIHFDEKTMKMPWDEFLELTISEFGAVGLVAGHDFHFGFKGEGNPERLRAKCAEKGIRCEIIPRIDRDGITISSTYIRELLRQGEIERANEFLGHPHVLTDIVRHGFRLGSTMGMPTINMRFTEGVIVPPFGVYATRVQLPNESFTRMAVTNIGVRPTVGGADDVSVESYILDYSGDLYGALVRVEFYKMLRPEKKFAGVAELQTQIRRDIDITKEYFAARK